MGGEGIRRIGAQCRSFLPRYLLRRRDYSNSRHSQRRHMQRLADVASGLWSAARMMVQKRTAAREVQQRQAAQHRQRASPACWPEADSSEASRNRLHTLSGYSVQLATLDGATPFRVAKRKTGPFIYLDPATILA
jgi:hypothetical protein